MQCIQDCVYKVFQPVCKRKSVGTEFPAFLLNGNILQFVTDVRYLGHMVNNKLSDDDDINREIPYLFMRTNILVRRYGKCSTNVKLALFRAYCMSLCDVVFWGHCSTTVFNELIGHVVINV